MTRLPSADMDEMIRRLRGPLSCYRCFRSLMLQEDGNGGARRFHSILSEDDAVLGEGLRVAPIGREPGLEIGGTAASLR